MTLRACARVGAALAFILSACVPTARARTATATQGGIPAATAPAFAVTLRPAQAEPGGIVIVCIDDPAAAVEHLAGHFRNQRLTFFSDADGRARALVGVDLETPPGTYPLRIERTSHDERRTVTTELTVRAKEFPREDLTVDHRYVEPDARTLARIRREQARLDAVLAAVSPRRLWTGAFQMPAEGPLGSSFGLRRFFNGQARSPHTGQDLLVPEGTPVGAAQAGHVVLAAPLFFSGNTVVLDHGLGVFTLYFHLAAFRVREGTVVARGAMIGTSGRTGRVTGAHLHWAARVGGARVDPLLLTGDL